MFMFLDCMLQSEFPPLYLEYLSMAKQTKFEKFAPFVVANAKAGGNMIDFQQMLAENDIAIDEKEAKSAYGAVRSKYQRDYIANEFGGLEPPDDFVMEWPDELCFVGMPTGGKRGRKAVDALSVLRDLGVTIG